jgi:hypothetical protein
LYACVGSHPVKPTSVTAKINSSVVLIFGVLSIVC